MKPLPLINQPVAAPPVDSCCSTDDCCSSSSVETAAEDPQQHEGADRSVVRVDGMDCASCAVTLERTVSNVDGVLAARVNFAAARLTIEHDGSVTDAVVEAAVKRAGFTVAASATAPRIPMWRLARARQAAAAAALFVVGFALLLGGMASDDLAVIVVFGLAIVIGGVPIFRSAWAALRARHMDMNVLMAAASIGAAVIGEWAEAAAVVVLFSIGNLLQTYAIDRTRGAVSALAGLAPEEVLVQRGGESQLVPAASIVVGDQVIVRPGERIAVDGIVDGGATTVDESSITGESTPIEKGIGDRVLSGSLNGSGSIDVTVERDASNSTLQQVVRLVEQAQASRAPSEQLVDRFSRIYTPVVVAAAVALIIIPILAGGDPSTWVYRGLALLIIACPCSLVISTPVTVVSGIGAASRRGILIKGGEALEGAGRLRAMALDKTGTLTEGRPVVASIHVIDGSSEPDALRIAAALERRSEHPLAHAVLEAAAGLKLPEVDSFRSITGRGAEGTIDGASYLIGSQRLFRERGIDLSATTRTALEAIEQRGETPVVLGSDSQVLAIFGLGDEIRPDAAQSIAQLRACGIREIVMLTGDSEGAARRIAEQLGIDYRAELLPEQKVEAVRELVTRHGSAGMVGDGINDAPALAAASTSFAMGVAGSPIALEAADVALMHDDLRKLAGAVRLSHAAERVLRQNIVASIVIKGAFVLLAPFGLVTLWIAVLADMGTSLGVTANGLRLFRHR
jgi:Cd2+/Zn2+-exporting ATPase